jgi:hypothetical protein
MAEYVHQMTLQLSSMIGIADFLGLFISRVPIMIGMATVFVVLSEPSHPIGKRTMSLPKSDDPNDKAWEMRARWNVVELCALIVCCLLTPFGLISFILVVFFGWQSNAAYIAIGAWFLAGASDVIIYCWRRNAWW